ncbi:putative MFS hexose transporter [Aspergillus similis]
MDTESNSERLQLLIRAELAWWKSTSLVKLYLLLMAPLLTSTAWGFDNSLTNGLQSVDRFMEAFDNPAGPRLGFFGAAASVGGIVACLIGGPLVERFGRRPMCSIGALLVVAMAIMQTFATNFGMFTGGKLLLGLGSYLQQVAAPVLVTELAHPKQRVAISSLYNTSIFIGLIIGSWATFGTYRIDSAWSWKIPCLLQAALPAYQLVMIWLCPESPRWLAAKGRIEEARAILIKWHGNGVETELVRLELQEILAGIQADKTVIKVNWEGIKSTWSMRSNRLRLWLCLVTAVGSQTIGGGFTSNYLPLILDQIGMRSERDKTLINAILNIFNWACAFLAAFIIPRVGRRTIFLVSAGGINIAFILWTALSARYETSGRLSYGIGVLVMIILNSFFTCICWVPLVIAYPIETVTTKQRSVYFAITLFSINVTAFVTSYLSPVGIGNIGWRYYIPYCIWNAIVLAIVYFTFVETKGLTLEEIATLFDGDDAFVDPVHDHAATDELNSSLRASYRTRLWVLGITPKPFLAQRNTTFPYINCPSASTTTVATGSQSTNVEPGNVNVPRRHGTCDLYFIGHAHLATT